MSCRPYSHSTTPTVTLGEGRRDLATRIHVVEQRNAGDVCGDASRTPHDDHRVTRIGLGAAASDKTLLIPVVALRTSIFETRQ